MNNQKVPVVADTDDGQKIIIGEAVISSDANGNVVAQIELDSVAGASLAAQLNPKDIIGLTIYDGSDEENKENN